VQTATLSCKYESTPGITPASPYVKLRLTRPLGWIGEDIDLA